MSELEKRSGRPQMPASKFGDVFRSLIGDKSTQQEVADKIGVSRQNVGKWLSPNPTTPDITTLCKIADAYDVSTDYLLGRTTVKSPKTQERAVCKFTGLSQEAVEEILRLKNYEDDSLYPYCYSNCENHLQMIDLINFFIGKRYETTNLDEENVLETYFSLIMQAALQYTETIYGSNSSGNSRTEKLLNNAAKWEAVEIFKDFLDEAAKQIAMSLKGEFNNGNS